MVLYRQSELPVQYGFANILRRQAHQDRAQQLFGMFALSRHPESLHLEINQCGGSVYIGKLLRRVDKLLQCQLSLWLDAVSECLLQDILVYTVRCPCLTVVVVDGHHFLRPLPAPQRSLLVVHVEKPTPVCKLLQVPAWNEVMFLRLAHSTED